VIGEMKVGRPAVLVSTFSSCLAVTAGEMGGKFKSFYIFVALRAKSQTLFFANFKMVKITEI
jgi:hypothetical protein